ncbi:MAG: hypothetical protein NTW30_04060 [Candidatus Aenigmarchaeota archaeon]|nr:hypothetical protein [Candidatus Aenigmarchaeota archaeon]
MNSESENYLNLHNVLHPTTGPTDQNPIEFNMPPNTGTVPDKSEPGLCEGAIILDAEDGEVGKSYNNQITVSGEDVKGPFKFLPPFDSIAEAAFPPGITLSSDGTVSGVSTKAGSYEFEACAENNDGDGDCFCVRLFVRPEMVTTTTTTILGRCYPCPTTSCDTGECCCETKNGIRTSAVLTFDCCERCPNDTHEVGKDRITQGGPYKICQCNKCYSISAGKTE